MPDLTSSYWLMADLVMAQQLESAWRRGALDATAVVRGLPPDAAELALSSLLARGGRAHEAAMLAQEAAAEAARPRPLTRDDLPIVGPPDETA